MAVELSERSRAARLYAAAEASERYCDFGLSPEHRRSLHDGGLKVVGVDQDGEARILELADHRFYVATLFVPQVSSSAGAPHPLITGYLREAAAGL
jgi:CTP synthase (UTP-ammonia lyase)